MLCALHLRGGGGSEEAVIEEAKVSRELTAAAVKHLEELEKQAAPVQEIHVEVPVRENYPEHIRYVAFWAKLQVEVKDLELYTHCTAGVEKDLDDDDMLVFSQIAVGDGVFKHITELSFSGNTIGDEGARHIATAITAGALPRLRELYLGRNEIGDAGLERLLPAHATIPLERFNLSHNKISDVGAVALAMTAATEEASPPFDRLREVWLSGGRINEKGVQALTYALQNGALPAIEELTLTSNPCSAKTMLAFQQQMDARKAGMTVVVSLEQLAKQFHNE